MITKLAPSVRLPYKQIRGSLEQRQQTAIGLVDKLYRDLYPKFNKNNELSLTEIQKSIDDIFEKKVKIIVKENPTPEFDGGSDVICSPINGCYTATTLELNTNKKGNVHISDLITIVHEFQHIVDQLYSYEYPETNADKREILKILEHKIKKFLRGINTSKKLDYIQDARYSLMMEEQAYRTQLKYAKKLHKKHLPIKDGELDDEISLQMLKEKIQLLKQIGFELIEKERGKHAAKLKKQKYKNQ